MHSFGQYFRITIWGESHGQGVGIVVDGCPPGISLLPCDFMVDMKRRAAGVLGTTTRREIDKVQILSGVFEGYTTGASIMLYIENKDVSSAEYDTLRYMPRPGHADYAAYMKYKGYHDHRGGGMFSGRMTAALVAAGVIAKKIIPFATFKAEVIEAGGQTDIESAITHAIERNDSIGGIVECRVRGIPAGVGSPFFNGLESVISHIVFSIPAIKAIEFGDGFMLARMSGVEVNDVLLPDGSTVTNHLGGINGGIANGNEIVLRVCVRPPSSIAREQQSFDIRTGEIKNITVRGRHDVCIALRVPVVLEAAVAIALADSYLEYLQWQHITSKIPNV